jgi:hypothetical protein
MASAESERSVEQRLVFSIHYSQFTLLLAGAVDATKDAGDEQDVA